ncbi:right-handed parallel beta-helix repeat-containing protein [Akkermansiaceae bacterium]|nr:right-handed parallel beta-helix repeat-containing protein [Akkermansiaceae bacterium]
MTALSCTLFLAAVARAADYHFDASNGDDAAAGTSPEQAWRSLGKASSVDLKPGDRLLFKAGERWSGQLSLKGGGTPEAPVKVAGYGEGSRPRIDGNGKVAAAVFLENVHGIEVRGLELTNSGPTRKQGRFGIQVKNESPPVARHIVIADLYVHDVNGALAKTHFSGAAIQLDVTTDKPVRFDGVLIENCHIRHCSRNGILVRGGQFRPHWNPSTGVVIRNNLIEGVGGDGIVPSYCDGALVEWNTMRDCPRYGEEGGAAAGIWPFSCDNTILQFNEVSGHKAWIDAQAFDCDYNCNNTTYRYNYGHGNEGGFMLMCSPGIKNHGWLVHNAWNRGSIVRHNLSINDGSRTTGGEKHYFSPTFSITGETTQDSIIRDNLIIIPKKADPRMDTDLIQFGEWGGKAPVNTLIRDNTFVLAPGQKGTFSFDRAKGVRIEGNKFFGEVAAITGTAQVKARDNHFQVTAPDAVEIRGTAEELAAFRDFLEKKGNPQEQQGIRIKWAEN